MLKTVDQKVVFNVGACLVGILVALFFELAVNIVFPQPSFFFCFDRFAAVAITVAATIFLIKYRQYFCRNLHRAFLLIGLTFGVSLILVFPRMLYASPDDQIHFRNAYFFMNDAVELRGGFSAIESSGFVNIKDKGFDEMSGIYDEINQADEVIINQAYEVNDSPQLYTRIIYLPFHLGLRLANLLHLKFTTGVVIAKIFNLACYILMVYFAIKLSGKFNKIFFVVGLLTANLFLATQFSYDPLIFASLLLTIGIFLHIRQTEKVSTKYFLGFVLAAVFGSLTKAVYCPILLLALMIPNNKFDCKKRAIAFKVCTMLVMLVLASTFVLPILTGSLAGDIRGGNTSVSGQISFLLHNPLKAIAVFVIFIVGTLPKLALEPASFVGLGAGATAGPLYHRCFPAVILVEIMSLILILWATFTTKPDKALSASRFKIGIAVIYFIIAGAIAASMYLSFTTVGNIYIDGLQPRYFMPFLPLLLILFIPSKLIQDRKAATCDWATLFVPYVCLALILTTYVLRMSML